MVLVIALLLFGFSVGCFLKKDDSFSDSERRNLKQFPKITMERIVSGEFMEEFEAYCLDQFPYRDKLRSLKAMVKYGLFLQKDNNGIYYSKGHLSKMEYPMNLPMLEYAVNTFDGIYDMYLREQGNQCYMAIVPDKNIFLAKDGGYLAMDYDALFSYMEAELPYMEFLDIVPFLDISDYYRTDTHWKQECIMDVAEYVKNAMQNEKGERKSKEEIEKRAEERFHKYKL